MAVGGVCSIVTDPYHGVQGCFTLTFKWAASLLSYNKRAHHISDLWVCGLHQHTSVGRNIVHKFIEGGPLDLLALQVCYRVQEVKDDAALLKFLGEQFLLFGRGSVWNDRN